MSHDSDLLDDKVSSLGDGAYEYASSLTDEDRAQITVEPISPVNDVLSWAEGSPIQRTIVCGSRSIHDEHIVEDTMAQIPQQGAWVPSELVHGGADGVDTIADTVGRRSGSQWNVVTTFEPRWRKFGPKAGLLRNTAMVEYADAVIAIWDGQSTGTKDTIDTALDNGLDVHVIQID